MIEIRQVIDGAVKSTICDRTLRSLPSWYANEAVIIDYIERVKEMPFYAAYDDEKPVGFVAIKIHNAYTAEVCVMGLAKEYHRQGIGKKLIRCCEDYCLDKKMDFLTVKTLDGSARSKSYEKTRLFYLSMGFKPLEMFPLCWDKDNPCLFMVKVVI